MYAMAYCTIVIRAIVYGAIAVCAVVYRTIVCHSAQLTNANPPQVAELVKRELRNQNGGGGGGNGGGRGGNSSRGRGRGGRGGGARANPRDIPTENELGRPVWVRRDAVDLARNPVCVNWR